MGLEFSPGPCPALGPSPFPPRWVVSWNQFCLIWHLVEGVGQLRPHWATHAGVSGCLGSVHTIGSGHMPPSSLPPAPHQALPCLGVEVSLTEKMRQGPG